MKAYEWSLNMRESVNTALSKIAANADGVSSKFTGLQSKINSFNSGSIDRTNQSLSNLKSLVLGVVAGFGVMSTGTALLDTAIQVESLKRSFKFVEGDAKAGGEAFQYVKESSDRLGVSFETLASGYKMIGSAAKGTVLAGQASKDVLEGVTMAASSLGLSADDTTGALLAISQMMSKGKVSAEELRGQLGERIPGAFQIAAQAMGMTTQAFDKLMSSGNIAATDFIPKFAKAMKERFAGTAVDAAHSLQAATNRLKNEFYFFKSELAEALAPAFADLVSKLRSGVVVFKELFDWTKRNWEAVKLVTEAVLLGVGAWQAYKIAMAIAAVATEAYTAVQWLLNIAMDANPVGAVVLAIMALAAAFVFAWNNCDQFRAIMTGLFEVVMRYFEIWWAVAKNFPLIWLARQLIAHWSEVKAFFISAWTAIEMIFDKVANSIIVKWNPVVLMLKGTIMALQWLAKAAGFTDAFSKGYDSVMNPKGASASAAGRPDLSSGISGLGVHGDKPGDVPGNVAAGINNINGGGKEQRILNVNIQKLATIDTHTTTLKESMSDVKTMIEEYLIRAVQGAEITLAGDR